MMILCLTGTNPYSFLRLVSYVDKHLGPKFKVVIQLGNTRYNTKFSESFDYCRRDRVFDLIEEADLIITQGGYGSMTDVLTKNKKLIAVPRSIKLNEAQDDQNELVEYYASKNFLLPCFDVENLENLVNKLINNEIVLTQYKPESDNKVKDLIEDYLNNLKL